MEKVLINQLYLSLDQEIKDSIERKLYEYYELEKLKSIIFVPLYSCILQGGGSNHFQPLISFSEYFSIRSLINDFKDVYIFPGYFRDIDDISELQFENMLKIVNLYHSLFDKSLGFDASVDLEVERFINLFTNYKVANNHTNMFDGSSRCFCVGLEETLKMIKTILTDSELKPVIILPRDDVFRCNYSYTNNGIDITKENIKQIRELKDEFGATIFLASNNAGKDSHCEGVALRFYEELFENEFPIIKSVDEFMSIYSKKIMHDAKEAIAFNNIIEKICTGGFGDNQDEIIKNISGIDILSDKKVLNKRKTIDTN